MVSCVMASKMQFFAFISSLLVLINTGHSFSPASTLHPASRLSTWQPVDSPISRPCRTNLILFASPNDPETEAESVAQEESVPSNTPVATKAEPAVAEADSAPYPVDLPSPLLLSASMVLAIASTGSLFELTGGAPTLGFGPTAAIAAIGLPSCLFLFYAAILKGMAETEEDDRQYNKPRGF
eukprot:CCRYP_002816-RA/>CCRYP_002816-RA protein AED:0.04 eAED:0.04 QI:284/1/1/1/1/1/2/225/181